MKNTILFPSLLLFLLFFGCNNNSSNLVNPIIGDVSFVETFGFRPDENTDNDLRIKTHLQYVERLLRNKDVSFLSKELKNKRTHLLDLLHTYSMAGNFPRNYDYANQRKPCFIDKDKTICAVGYLIEQTAGRDVAEAINASHKYDTVMEMESEDVDQWIASSGLTKEEYAMIQPTYGPQPIQPPSITVQPHYRMKSGYVISSGILMGANVSLNVMNEFGIANGSRNKTVPFLGILVGAGQATLGAIAFNPRETPAADYNYSDQHTLSIINICLGTATGFFSARNLAWQRKMANRRTSWNIFSFPAGKKQTGVVLSFSRKI